MTNPIQKDDPHDDITTWLEGLHKRDTNQPEHTVEPTVGRSKKPDIQRKKSPEAEGEQTEPDKTD